MISIYLGLPSPSRPEWVRVRDPERRPRVPCQRKKMHLTRDVISPVSALRARPPTVHRLQATLTVHAWCKFWCDLAECSMAAESSTGHR